MQIENWIVGISFTKSVNHGGGPSTRNGGS